MGFWICLTLLAGPATAEPGWQRANVPSWEEVEKGVNSKDHNKQSAVWRQLERGDAAAIPSLQRLSSEHPDHRSRALLQLRKLARGEDLHVARSAYDALQQLTGNPDQELVKLASSILDKLSILTANRLRFKGLKVTPESIYPRGYGRSVTLSSEWTGTGADLLALELMGERVAFFGGFFGEVNGEEIRSLCQISKLGKMFIAVGDFHDDDLQELGQLQELWALSLNDVPISDKGLRGFSKLTQLEELYLRNLPVTDATLLRMAGPDRARLRVLVVPGTEIGDAGLSIFQGKHAPGTLDLSETRVTDAGLAPLDLRDERDAPLSIAVSGTATTGRWLKALPAGKAEINELHLNDTPLDDDGLLYLKGKSLRELNLQGTPITGRGLAHLKYTKSCVELDLSRTDLQDQDLAALAAVPSLGWLTLAETSITGEGLRHLGREELRALIVNETAVDDAGLLHLVACKGLWKLNLADTKITGRTLGQLSHLPLRYVDFSGTLVDDAARESIGKMTELRSLKLNGTRVTNEGLKHLAGLKDLVVLELDDTQITGAGIEHLARVEPLSILSLAGTPIGDADLPPLEKIHEGFTFQLQRTAVTPAGLRAFFRRMESQDRTLWIHLTKTPAFEKLDAEQSTRKSKSQISFYEP